VLTFDIISTNSFVLQFQYVFASEEYPEWIWDYNDPMAIFLSTNREGTDWIIISTNNLALVPCSSDVAVTVNTINGGCTSPASPATNAHYYVDNHDPTNLAAASYSVGEPVFTIEYDGLTVLLTAQAFISANVTNHIKIGIADFGGPYENDYVYDSTLFLKAWSPSQCE
jgi:hypothetical protein